MIMIIILIIIHYYNVVERCGLAVEEIVVRIHLLACLSDEILQAFGPFNIVPMPGGG